MNRRGSIFVPCPPVLAKRAPTHTQKNRSTGIKETILFVAKTKRLRIYNHNQELQKLIFSGLSCILLVYVRVSFLFAIRISDAVEKR